MDNQNQDQKNQPETKDVKPTPKPDKNKSLLMIILTFLITTLLVGGAVFAWQRSQANKLKKEKNEKIEALKQKIDNLNQKIGNMSEINSTDNKNIQLPQEEDIVSYLKESVWIGDVSEGRLFTDFKILGENSQKEELYIYAFMQEYYKEGGALKEGSGSSYPVVIEFSDGDIIGHQRPESGEGYSNSIRELFPSKLHNKIFNFSVENLQNNLEQKAENELLS